jgi:hypothetical protein
MTNRSFEPFADLEEELAFEARRRPMGRTAVRRQARPARPPIRRPPFRPPFPRRGRRWYPGGGGAFLDLTINEPDAGNVSCPCPQPADPEGVEEEYGPEAAHRTGGLSSFPAAVLEALRKGLERAAIQIAVKSGFRDETRLTSLIFYARHPERGGRPIAKSEPGFKASSQEWLDIRDRLVRPVLAGVPATPSVPTGPPGSFQPVPVESPGGDRIKDKRDPSPADMVKVPRASGGSVPLHRLAARALDAMIRAARADGIAAPLLLPVSGYRSAATQARLWKNALAKAGGDAQEARKWVAPPGKSAHQSGRAVDLYLGYGISSKHVAAMRKTAAWRWLAQNAVRFGFYPYPTEPWHWEYNPPARPEPVTPAPRTSPTLGPAPTGGILYTVVPGQEYGSKWRSQRPPGLPATARQASARGAAMPHIDQIAGAEGLGDIFVRTVRHLSETESAARFGLPANIFDARPPAQRPPGKSLITAWGAFQFNRDAWRALPGVAKTAFPWDSTPREEIARPIARYARLFRDVRAAGGSPVDAARSIRLWHITPAGFHKYLKTGKSSGFSAAWQQVAADRRQQIDKRLRESGVGA